MGNVTYKFDGAIKLQDSASIDAFGRLRISEPYILFDIQNQYNKSPFFWEENS